MLSLKNNKALTMILGTAFWQLFIWTLLCFTLQSHITLYNELKLASFISSDSRQCTARVALIVVETSHFQNSLVSKLFLKLQCNTPRVTSSCYVGMYSVIGNSDKLNTDKHTCTFVWFLARIFTQAMTLQLKWAILSRVVKNLSKFNLSIIWTIPNLNESLASLWKTMSHLLNNK